MVCTIDDYLSALLWILCGKRNFRKKCSSKKLCSFTAQQCVASYNDDFCCPVLFYWIWEEREMYYFKNTVARLIEWRKFICRIVFISSKTLLYFFPFPLGFALEPQQSMVWKGLLEIIWSLSVGGIRFDYSGHYQAESQFFPPRRFHHFFEGSFPKFSCSHWNIYPPIFTCTFPCSNLCPLPMFCENISWWEEYLCFLYMYIFF